uniref:PGG domain-containing protein n=1 Tax=Aegilops tauschii subsp. strangulata TaxID=200361 RepID=A0A453RD82_AEGTS
MAGDPILLTTNPGRYKAFFYCNSVAFVASLVAIILVQNKLLLKTHVLEAAMVLDLFGLIGAYAAGSCRDVSTSIYAMALAGGVLVYVVIHVVFFTLDHTDTITPQEIEMVEKRRKRLLLFAVLAATVTYQAGLTPPGGFRLHDDESGGFQAGDPVLLNNFPRRYTAYFYCNSVSFMLSIALIILLVNPHLYRPAIRSYALAICTAVGMFGLMGAYAAGSTQHLKTSIYIFALVVVVLFVIAGLDPPGGAWQHSSEWYDAGNPVMHDNRRPRYLAFFYSNSTSFVASIVVIIILLLEWKDKTKRSLTLRVLSTTIVLDLLALLVAYAAGSSRGWKTSVYVVALIIAVLAYIAIHVILAFLCSHPDDSSQHPENPPPIQEEANGGNQGNSFAS